MIHHDWQMRRKDFVDKVSPIPHEDGWHCNEHDIALVYHDTVYVWNIPQDVHKKPKYTGPEYLKVVQNYFAILLKLPTIK